MRGCDLLYEELLTLSFPQTICGLWKLPFCRASSFLGFIHTTGAQFSRIWCYVMWYGIADLNVCSEDGCIISQLFAFLKSPISVRRTGIAVCFDWQVVVLTGWYCYRYLMKNILMVDNTTVLALNFISIK